MWVFRLREPFINCGHPFILKSIFVWFLFLSSADLVVVLTLSKICCCISAVRVWSQIHKSVEICRGKFSLKIWTDMLTKGLKVWVSVRMKNQQRYGQKEKEFVLQLLSPSAGLVWQYLLHNSFHSDKTRSALTHIRALRFASTQIKRLFYNEV